LMFKIRIILILILIVEHHIFRKLKTHAKLNEILFYGFTVLIIKMRPIIINGFYVIDDLEYFFPALDFKLSALSQYKFKTEKDNFYINNCFSLSRMIHPSGRTNNSTPKNQDEMYDYGKQFSSSVVMCYYLEKMYWQVDSYSLKELFVYKQGLVTNTVLLVQLVVALSILGLSSLTNLMTSPDVMSSSVVKYSYNTHRLLLRLQVFFMSRNTGSRLSYSITGENTLLLIIRVLVYIITTEVLFIGLSLGFTKQKCQPSIMISRCRILA
ncbi:hypothetical protein L9F63_021796, partial [Diploptera punctata]